MRRCCVDFECNVNKMLEVTRVELKKIARSSIMCYRNYNVWYNETKIKQLYYVKVYTFIFSAIVTIEEHGERRE